MCGRGVNYVTNNFFMVFIRKKQTNAAATWEAKIQSQKEILLHKYWTKNHEKHANANSGQFYIFRLTCVFTTCPHECVPVAHSKMTTDSDSYTSFTHRQTSIIKLHKTCGMIYFIMHLSFQYAVHWFQIPPPPLSQQQSWIKRYCWPQLLIPMPCVHEPHPDCNSTLWPCHQRSVRAEVKWLVGYNPEENLQCCQVTSVVSSDTFWRHHLLRPKPTKSLSEHSLQIHPSVRPPLWTLRLKALIRTAQYFS